MRIDLTIEQYILVIRSELAKRLSYRCGVRIIGGEIYESGGQNSIRISWDNWNFEFGFENLKIYYNGGTSIDDCVRIIIQELQSEFVKILFKEENQQNCNSKERRDT